MNYRRQYSRPRATALSLGVAIALSGGIVAAQDAPSAEDATTLDRIEVTGTRIRQVDIETAQPVQIIGRQEIERQGFQSLGDILQNITAAGQPPISRAQPLSAGEAPGGHYIQMRDLGPNRTLILVNGRRLGVTTGGLQDTSQIPTVAIERVEILKDGASSIYGSDAIGGVINIITRSGMEGAIANAYYGQYSEGDGAITRGDFIVGFTGDRGSVTAAVDYRKEDEVMSADRSFTAYPQSDRHPDRGWTTASQWGVLVLPTSIGGGGYLNNRVLDQGADWRDLANYHVQDCDSGSAPGTQPPDCTGSGGAGSPIDKSNTNQQTQLRTPVESRSLFLNANYDLSDSIMWQADVLYTDRRAQQVVAGYPYVSLVDGGVVSADSYFNPIGTHHGFDDPQDVNFVRRAWEVPRMTYRDTDTWRFSTGLDGTVTFGDRYFDWDVGYLYSRSTLSNTHYGQFNKLAVDAALGPSFFNETTGRVECGTADNPIPYGSGAGACVPWNPFIPFGRSGDGGLTENPQLQAFLMPAFHDTGLTETRAYGANLGGSLFSLPAGDFAFAAGVEHRKESGEYEPDAMAVAGHSTNLAASPTRGSYSVDEIYLEFLAPILSDMPGARELTLTAASRYSDYDTFGDTTNSKVGLKWKPVDTLLVRGTWAEGFRAPTISNLYGGGSQTYSFFTDPCDTQFGASASNPEVRARCAQVVPDADNFRQLAQGFLPSTQASAQTPVPFVSGSNPQLQPETSVSRTIGMVWSPEFIGGMNLSLDWWKIRVENTIVGDSATQMLADCYVQGIASRCAAPVDGSPGFTRDPETGMVNSLVYGSRNAGYVEVEGYDFGVLYSRETTLGDLTVDWQTTYFVNNELRSTNDENAMPQKTVGFWNDFRIKSVLNLGWSSGDWSANWSARYFSSFKDACLQPALFPEECSMPDYVSPSPGSTGTGPKNRNGSNTFQDVEVRWAAPWNATIAVGALNVFDRIGPPVYDNNNRGANVPYLGSFSDIGRFLYMKYQQRF